MEEKNQIVKTGTIDGNRTANQKWEYRQKARLGISPQCK